MMRIAVPRPSPPVASRLTDSDIELLARRYAAEMIRCSAFGMDRTDLPQISDDDYERLVAAALDLATGLELNAGSTGAELWKRARYNQDIGRQVER